MHSQRRRRGQQRVIVVIVLPPIFWCLPVRFRARARVFLTTARFKAEVSGTNILSALGI